MTSHEIQARLRMYRFDLSSEDKTQQGIAAALTIAGIAFQREVPLTKKDRLDFLIDGIALEVKLEGGRAALLRQLLRYAEHPEVRELMVFTSRRRLTLLPPLISGKSLTVCYVFPLH